MRKIFLALMLTVLLMSFSVFAEEEEGFAPEFGLEFEHLFGNDTDINAQIGGLTMEDTISGEVVFPIKFYAIALGIEDEFLLGWNGIEDAFPDVLTNDVTLSLGNTFTVEGIMDIGINYSQGFSYAAEYDEDDQIYGGDFTLGFAPELSFAGSYDFGFDWEVTDTLTFEMAASNQEYSGLVNELYLFLGWEFMHYFAPENIGGTLFAENDTLEISVADGNLEIANSVSLGVEFDFFGVAPYLKMVMEPGYVNEDDEIESSFPLGFGAGVSYGKDFFSIGIDYTGLSDIKADEDNWSNLIEAWLVFSL